MTLEYSADEALGYIDDWPYSLPLLATGLIFRAIEAKSGDPYLRAALMAELCHRLWLFPPSSMEAEEWRGKVEALWGGSLFWDAVVKWAENQALSRTYVLPRKVQECAKCEIEQITVCELMDILHKWRESHGVIAFLEEGETDADVPPRESTLLPFRLVESSKYASSNNFGLEAAFKAAGGREKFDKKPSLCFLTMPPKLPKWMDGKSGGLPIWYALLAIDNSLPVMPLDIGLAGCLNPQLASLDYRHNPGHKVAKKWDLFHRAKVPLIVLADTMENMGPGPCKCTLWPHSEILSFRMSKLIQSQIDRYPDAKELRRIEGCLVNFDDELNLEEAYASLRGIESKCNNDGNTAHKINLLAYICCCRLEYESEITEREGRILGIPQELHGEFALNMKRAANIAGGNAKERMKKLAAKLEINKVGTA